MIFKTTGKTISFNGDISKVVKQKNKKPGLFAVNREPVRKLIARHGAKRSQLKYSGVR